MPDYTVKADVDSMLRADNDAGIRSAIGLGQTDAPTFLAQTLTGQSLTGMQATSLLNLSTTWNTSGTPTALLINVTEAGVGSNAASKLIDVVYTTAAGAVKSPLSLTKLGMLNLNLSTESGGLDFNGYGLLTAFNWQMRNPNGFIGLGPTSSESTVKLFRDDTGILAQRNLGFTQAFRLYNATSATPLTDWDRASLSFTSGNFRIAAENSGTSGYNTARGIDFFVGGAVRVQMPATGGLLVPGDFIVGNTCRIGSGAGQVTFYAQASGVLKIVDASFTNFNRINLGGDTNAEPAIARDGAGIKFTGAAAGLTSWIKVPAVAVSALPAAATAGVGARSFVNDALTPVFGSAVVGLGSVTVPVYSTGSAWNVG